MSEEQRYVPDDGCPLFSERLEDHIVAVTRGEIPNRGRFCGNCYTPMSQETRRCRHCDEEPTSDHATVEQVPEPVVEMLRTVHKTEKQWVNGFAYLGLVVAVLGGLAVVLGIPYLRERLLAATIVYGVILLIGSRGFAGVLGGYYGDRIGYERARRTLLADWATWVEERAGAN
ncbi:MAG: hypothetical protein V3R95_04940 [Dehalococcoidia bacterium]